MRRARSRDEALHSPALARARRATIAGGVLAAVVVAAAILLVDAATARLEGLGLELQLATLAYWGIVLALLVPALALFYGEMGRWVRLARPPIAVNGASLRVREVVHVSFLLAGSILLGLPVLVATAPFLDTAPIAAGWILIVVVLAAFLYGRVRRLHGRLKDTLEAILEQAHPTVSVPRVLESLQARGLPLELKTATIVLSPEPWAGGRRLVDIRLRQETGATVLLVQREGTDGPEVPTAETVLAPGDELTLVGSDSELEAAKAVLARAKPTGDVRLEAQPGRIHVPRGSFLDGATLAEAALRVKYALQVVAILRADRTIANPLPDERLQAEDVLVVLGSAERIQALAKDLNPRPPRGPEGVAGDGPDAR
jgi:K+/H+ antiporter YhaU regulatory subunit KhtT